MAGPAEYEYSFKPKLIEVSIPLNDISHESARDKSLRHGHPCTLHQWWARRPIPACRAILFAQLVDDPSAYTGMAEDEQEKKRDELHQMISELIKWENVNNFDLLEKARKKIEDSCGGKPPPILDPFAGGGSIPLEAQRLGLDACGRDLNAVAVLVNKALIEIPPRWRDHPPVFPGVAAEAMSWPRAYGLAEDVVRYGQWICTRARDRIGHLYPTVTISGIETTVIAWIWARTITCPNPRCHGTMPLVGSFKLGTKEGKQRYIEPIAEGKRVRFVIRGPDGEAREKTISKDGDAVCLLCGSPVPLEYVKDEGREKRIGSQLMAIAAQGKRQRYYLPAEDVHADAARVPQPRNVPDEEIGNDPRNLWCLKYGFTRFGDLFTNRQLTLHITLTDLVRQARDRILRDGADPAYADAVTTYLALAVSKITDRHCILTTWDSHQSKEQVRGVFARQSIPMTWDYAEGNPFSASSGNLAGSFTAIAECLRRLPASPPGTAFLEDAALGPTNGRLLVATDPPYYDNISYANISDFYYVWLRRSLGEVHPGLMNTLLTAKQDEIVADPTRHGGAKAAREFYEDRFEKAFRRICKDTPKGYPISFFYAYKQTKQEKDGIFWTPWEILLKILVRAGWMITASWPIRSELKNRLRSQKSNALGSSVVLTCRPRPPHAPVTDRRGLVAALRSELPADIRMLVDTGIGPVDLRQSMIGPGMKIYSRYARVNEPDGEPMSVADALKLINQVYDIEMSQIEGDVSAETRWCIDWFASHGFDVGPSHQAEAGATSANIDVASLERSRLIRRGGGNVRLIAPAELNPDYDPSLDPQISEWTVTLQLARVLHDNELERGARMLATARERVDPETIRQLAYWIYAIADKKDWTETAAVFNALGTSWPELESESQKASHRSAQDPIEPR